MTCVAELRKASRALSSLSPVADATLATLDGRRVLELTLAETRLIPVAVLQIASAYSLRIDADHSGTRAGAALTVVLR